MIQNKSLDKLIEIIQTSVENAVESKLEGLTKQLDEIKEQNQELQNKLEEQQERHFANIDDKLNKWRDEAAAAKEKPKGIFSRFFK
ncbi:MAG: hypothetical protein APF77_18370 [Clostridia bacterium BRH_c25]|nr:MAG: hypothetical protein APF77_18370 [Clostridia bacterium BRH_c25]